MKDNKIQLILAAILILTCGVLGFEIIGLILRPIEGTSALSTSFGTEQMEKYANALRNEGLYEQAIDVYKEYLKEENVDGEIYANITYLIGNMYFDDLNKYDDAMAEYLKIAKLFPDSKVAKDANKKIITCLERLDRSLDAQGKLNRLTSLKPQKAEVDPVTGTIVAKIGDRFITKEQLLKEYMKMMPPGSGEVPDEEKLLQFLNSYIARELLYSAAKRESLDNDPDIIQRTFEYKKDLMTQKVYENRVSNKVNISDSDMELYYKANKDKYTDPEKVHLAHIVVENMEKANELKKKIEDGAEWDELVKEFSLDERTKEKGGDLGSWAKGQNIYGINDSSILIEKAFRLNDDEVSDPIEAGEQVHLVKCLGKTSEKVKTFDEVKEMVKFQLRHEKEQEIFKNLSEQMTKAEKVEIFPEAVKN